MSFEFNKNSIKKIRNEIFDKRAQLFNHLRFTTSTVFTQKKLFSQNRFHFFRFYFIIFKLIMSGQSYRNTAADVIFYWKRNWPTSIEKKEEKKQVFIDARNSTVAITKYKKKVIKSSGYLFISFSSLFCVCLAVILLAHLFCKIHFALTFCFNCLTN